MISNVLALVGYLYLAAALVLLGTVLAPHDDDGQTVGPVEFIVCLLCALLWPATLAMLLWAHANDARDERQATRRRL